MSKFRLQLSLMLATALAAAPRLAFAQQTQPTDEIVVVANRAPDPQSKIGASVSVLDAGAIQASQASTLADLIDQTPGVAMVRNGGEGQPTAIFIRGADSDQTMVLVDGVQLNDPGSPSGGFDFSDILAGDVSRVEVLRGSQSTLWGSQAIGGVISIVTAEPDRTLAGSADLEGGSRGTQYYRLGVGDTIGNLSLRLAGGYYDTDGISAFDKAFGGHEADGYRNSAFSGRLGYAFTPDISLDLRGFVTNSRAGFDGFDTASGSFGDDNEYGITDQYVGYAGLNFALFGGALKNRVSAQYTDIDRHQYDPGPYFITYYADPGAQTFYSSGVTERFEYQGTWQVAPAWRAVFGAQHERSTITTDTPAFDFTPGLFSAHATIDSGYGQVEGEAIRGLNLTAGVRYDDHSTFGGHTTGQASAAWDLNGGNTILRASFSQGFKAPALYQLFSPYANLALKPETSNSWDAGIEQHFWDGRAMVQGTYFGRRTHDLIEFISCFGVNAGQCATNTSGGYYDNVDRASAEGVELQAEVHPLEALSIEANYTFTDTKDLTTGKLLPRRPQDTANALVSYVWPARLTTALAVRYAGDTWDDAANTTRLKAYTLVDLRASYPLNDRLELYGRIENLFDQHYETAFQFGSLGRGGFVGVRAKF